MAWTNKQHKNRPNATRLNKKSLATIFKEIICTAPADHSANHSTNQPARQPANQPVNQPTTKLANQPADWPTSPPINQPAGKSVSLTVSHPASQPSLARHQARQATNPAQPTTQLRPPWASQPSYARAAQPGSPAQPSLAASQPSPASQHMTREKRFRTCWLLYGCIAPFASFCEKLRWKKIQATAKGSNTRAI